MLTKSNNLHWHSLSVTLMIIRAFKYHGKSFSWVLSSMISLYSCRYQRPTTINLIVAIGAASTSDLAINFNLQDISHSPLGPHVYTYLVVRLQNSNSVSSHKKDHDTSLSTQALLGCASIVSLGTCGTRTSIFSTLRVCGFDQLTLPLTTQHHRFNYTFDATGPQLSVCNNT